MAAVERTITTVQRKFTDLDFNLTMNPGNGDVAKKVDSEAIKQSLKNLILTKPYERPFNPRLGSQVYGLLFELPSVHIKITLERVIADLISTYEPRVELLGVDVTFDGANHSLDVQLQYMVIGIGIPTTYSFNIDRTR